MTVRARTPSALAPAIALLLWLAASLPVFARAAEVRLRAGEHDEFSRVVFDFAAAPDYRSEATDGRLVLHFATPFTFDTDGIDVTALRSLDGIETSPDGRSVIFDHPADAKPRILVVEGRRLVVDFVRDTGSSPTADAAASSDPQTAAPPAPAARAARTAADGDGKKASAAPAHAAGKPDGNGAHRSTEELDPLDRAALAGLAAWAKEERGRIVRDRERRALKVGEEIIAKLAEKVAAEKRESTDSEPPRKTAPARTTDRPTTDAVVPDGQPARMPSAEDGNEAALAAAIDSIRPTAGGGLLVTTTEDEEGFALVFAPPSRMTAAVFRRAGVLWVVFERAMAVDQSAVDISPGTPVATRVTAMETIDLPNATVLRYRLRGGYDVAVAERGRRWFVYLKDGATVPRRVLSPRVEIGEAGARVFVPIDDPGPRIDVTDPDVGDTISIVPIPGNAVGMIRDRRFPQFTLLKSAQGVVVVPLDERVEVRRYTNGVAIQADGGLELSEGLLGRTLESGAARPRRLVDLAAWRGGGPRDFRRREERLLVRLSLADPAQRPAVRWDLARFYLGYGMGPEGMAELALLAADQPAIADAPEYHAAKGIAAFLLNRPDEAMKALNDPRLDAESEVWLWRTRVYERLGWHAVAVQAYLQGREALVEQDPDFAVAVRLAAARAMIETSAFEKAKAELDDLEVLALDGKAAIETAWLRGRLAEATGDLASAREIYRDVAASLDRRLSVMARLALVELDLSSGDVSVGEAIEELERLHYAWRGDMLELRVLDRLGDLYVRAGRYRAALESWENAVAAFRDSPQARRIAAKMADVFRRLFLEGEADRLPAIKALGLFYDFRELTPLGADGDRMIRHLVDRMVELELYDRAAELLEHQVRFRLEGAAQSSVAVPLAKIYLLAGKPEKAIDILRATRQQLLAADVISARRRVEARALAELGRFEEAAAIIERERGREAELLRIDFYWGARDWKNLVRAVRRLLATRRSAGAPLDSDEQRSLVRMALALSFLDDRTALTELRRKYGRLMRDGTLAGLFDLLTSPEPPDLNTLQQISEQMAGLAAFGSYLDRYREEFVRAAHSFPAGRRKEAGTTGTAKSAKATEAEESAGKTAAGPPNATGADDAKPSAAASGAAGAEPDHENAAGRNGTAPHAPASGS